MSLRTHPWTFIHPVCGKASFHVKRIPRTSTHIATLAREGELEALRGAATRPGESALFRCGSCGGALGALASAATTVEANYRRRIEEEEAPVAFDPAVWDVSVISTSPGGWAPPGSYYCSACRGTRVIAPGQPCPVCSPGRWG